VCLDLLDDEHLEVHLRVVVLGVEHVDHAQVRLVRQDRELAVEKWERRASVELPRSRLYRGRVSA